MSENFKRYSDNVRSTSYGKLTKIEIWGYSQGKSTLKLNSSAYEKYEFGH